MKKLLSVLVVVLYVFTMTGCASYVNIDKNKDENIKNPKEETEVVEKIEKDEPIKPIVVQKIPLEQAKQKAEKTYGGKGVIVQLNGEYQMNDMTYYVFDFGADVGGMFSKDFSVVVDAQSGEMFEGTYDKTSKKIIKY